jgi:branched-chain amino acid transport system permease protein
MTTPATSSGRARRVILGVAAFAVLALLPAVLTPFQVRVAQQLFLAAGLSLAWTILGGFAGYWSFGHAAFVGVGAFAAGLVATRAMPHGTGGGWDMAIPVAAGGLASGVLAMVIAYPLLRLRGIYFAIAMLGVSQVAGELSANVEWIGGGLGLDLPPAGPASMKPENFFYYLLLAGLALTLGACVAIQGRRFGYGLIAIREDEDTARMLGVPTERYKIAAYVISAVLVGLQGAVFAYSLGYFTTQSVFRLEFSLNMIVYALIGGIGTLAGPMIGAGLMVVLTQVVLGSLLEFHVFITGAVVVSIVLLAPGGLIGLWHDLGRRGRGAAEDEA